MVGYLIPFAPQSSRVLNDMIPIGGIIQWSGAIVDIPSNFSLCDGTAGTPDLRDRFIVGAGNIYSPDGIGGDVFHDHLPGSTHACPGTGGVSAWTNGVSSIAVNLPPFYALANIMRIT